MRRNERSVDGDAGRWAAILEVVAREIDQRGERGWLVGGCLRDALLGKAVRDVDLAVTGDPLVYAEGVRMRLGAAIAPLNRATVRVVPGAGAELPGGSRREIDISALHGTTIEDDLLLRDFRVNALALPLAAYGEFVALLERAEQRGRVPSPPVYSRDDLEVPTPADLIDPLGLDDLKEHRLNLASSHALTDDPGRIVRAARLVTSHAFSPSEELLDAARSIAPLLRMVARDRLRDEMNAVLALPRAWQGLDFLAVCGALGEILSGTPMPGAVRHGIDSVRATEMIQEYAGAADMGQNASGYDGMARLVTLDAVRSWSQATLPDGSARIVALRWGLLLHALPDMSEAQEQVAYAQRALKHLPLATHMRVIAQAVLTCGAWRKRLAEREPNMVELRHFFAQFGDAGVDTLIGTVACGDALDASVDEDVRGASNVAEHNVAEQVRWVLALYFTERERLIPPPLLNGQDLMRDLGMSPGQAIRAVLQAVRKAQLDGVVVTRDEALAMAEERIRAEHGGR